MCSTTSTATVPFSDFALGTPAASFSLNKLLLSYLQALLHVMSSGHSAALLFLYI